MLIAVLGAASSGGAAWFVEQQGKREKRFEAQFAFQRQVERTGETVQRTIGRYLDHLYALRDFYRSVPRVSRGRFHAFVQRIIADNPAVQAMVWQERVTDAERPAYRRRMRAAGFPDFRITGLDGKPLPAHHREVYFPGTYIEPMASNEAALGFDSYDRPSERRAIRTAIARDTLTASGRIRLVQETQNQFGVVGYLPVYASASGSLAPGSPGTLAAAADTTDPPVKGLVLAVFRVPDLVRESMQLVNRPFDLLLTDASAPAEQQYLGHYRSETGRVRLDSAGRDRLAASFEERCPQPKICTYRLEVGQRRWTLRAVPPAGFFSVEGTSASTYVLLMGLLLTAALVAFTFYRQRHLEEVEELADRVQQEKENADRLLLNILPEEVAGELKRRDRVAPVYHDSASVLFADFVDFTSRAERLPAETLVEELDRLFSAFDRITERHGLEKIKTIGDAYMAAGGVPASSDTHAADCVRAGLDMLRHLREVNQRRDGESELEEEGPPTTSWKMRVGISSGPLTAGVIGDAKFAYDVFGDTVVTASRMESSGVPGRVNISGATRALLDERFACEPRGKVEAKGKGQIDMYLVKEDRRDRAPRGESPTR